MCPDQGWLTSTVRQAVEDVAFVTETLETAGGVDTKVVAGPVEGALVDVCAERKRQAVRNFSNGSTNDKERIKKIDFPNKTRPPLSGHVFLFWSFVLNCAVCGEIAAGQVICRHNNNKKKQHCERKASSVCYVV